MKTLKIRFFDNLICINAIYTSIRFIRNTNLSNTHQYITSNKVKTKGRKSSEKNILLIFHTCVVLHFSHFCHLMIEFSTEHSEFVFELQLVFIFKNRKQIKTWKILVNQHDFQFLGNCISMENQQNIFSEFFLNFVFSLLEAMY